MTNLTSTDEHLAFYIDGSCLENQNVTADTPAAWGMAVVIGDNGLGKGSGEIIEESWGHVVCNPTDEDFIGAEVGSNNTAELTAFAMALRWLLIDGDDKSAIIYTDSQYVKLGITEWINTWMKNNWKTSKKEDVKNKDLWVELYNLNKSLNVKWNWVKAHAGNPMNEEVDLMAKKAANLD